MKFKKMRVVANKDTREWFFRRGTTPSLVYRRAGFRGDYRVIYGLSVGDQLPF